MSTITAVLTWLAIVIGSTAAFLLLLSISDRSYRKRMLPWVQSLRCPACGRGYDDTTFFTSAARSHPCIDPAPGHKVTLPPPPPPETQVTCSECGCITFFTEQGQYRTAHDTRHFNA